MNVNTEVKGTLAKLLATENLTVEHRQVSTASFDVNNRVLILPIWKNASSIVYDLLVGHEVGHALYTPNLPIDAPKAFVNVIEDARIERMMKQTYPGLKKSFFEGYRELWHQDFFGVLDEDINALAFIDRINLYFKGNSEIEFSEEEKVWVDRVSTTKTFQDVLDLSQELYDYVSDKQESNLEKNMSFDLNDEPANGDEVEQDNDLEPNESEDGEDQDGEQQEGGSPHPFKRDDRPDPDLDTPNFSAGDLSGGTVDETESVTDEALRQALETLVDEEAEDWTYLTTPEVNLDKIVTKYDRIQEDLYYFFEGQAVESTYQEQIHKDNLEWSYKSYNEYKKEAQRSVNYLVKQFEMKKSADQYKRAATSKTGVIDTNSLYKYKITEDVFKRITTVPDGKNHGLIMFLDWSGSMQHVLQDTLKQTYNLVWFCRKAGIPFRVYGFQNTHGSCGPHSGVKPTHNSLAIMEDFALLEFFSSRQNAKSLDKSLKLLWTQVTGMGYGRVSYMQKYTLGGTPLAEAVMCAPKLVERLKQVENVTKVNVVALTDGESNPLSHLVEHDGDEYYYRSKGEISVRSLYRGRRMKYILRDKKSGYSRELNPSQFITTQEIVSFYRKITDYNWIGIRICSKSELGRVSRMLSYEDGQLLDQQWKKYKYASIKDQVGFDQSFYIPNQGIGSTTDEIEVKQKGEVATKAELNRAFKKHMGSKKSNKTILNAFIEQIA